MRNQTPVNTEKHFRKCFSPKTNTALVSSFTFSDFIHVHRACNFAADALAKKAKNLMGSQVWLDVMPEDITPLIGFDVH